MEQQSDILTEVAQTKKRKIYRISMVVLITLIVVGGLGFIFKKQIGLFLFDSLVASDIKETLDRSYEPIGIEPKFEPDLTPNPPLLASSAPFSVLLLGLDPRGNERGRSDSIVISIIRPSDNKMLLVSIPRDAYVEIYGYTDREGKLKTTKINAAYSYGGAKMSINTVEHLLKNTINYYATVNFNGLKDVVNALGGIPLPITELIETRYPNDGITRIEPNKPIYNGQEALSYVRYRGDSDEYRTGRHRLFLNAVMNELFKFKHITAIPELIDIAGANFRTNMSADLILSTAKQFFMQDSLPTLSSYMLHGKGFRSDAWYYDIDSEDLVYTQQLIKNWMNPNTPIDELMNPELENERQKQRS